MNNNYTPYKSKSKVVVEEPPVKSIITYVKLQSLIDAHLHYDGEVSKRHYEWQRAGSIVPVLEQDASVLLEKRIKSQSCCNTSDVAVFQVVD